MRPPRHRFSDEVRSTTREMASRMAREGSVPDTQEELDAWISAAPEAREPLVRGGYGRDFGADDLLPLLHVFAGRSEGPARPAVPPARTSRSLVLPALVFLAVLVVVAVAVWVGVSR